MERCASSVCVCVCVRVLGCVRVVKRVDVREGVVSGELVQARPRTSPGRSSE